MSSQAGGRRAAAVWLAVACVAWGWSFPAAKWAIETMSERVDGASDWVCVSTFCGWRFALAALLYAVLTFPAQTGYTRADVRGGLWCGLFCAGGALLQILGLRYTTPSVSAFLTGLTVIVLPLAQLLLFRKKIAWLVWPAVLLALAGTVCLSWPDGDVAAQAAPFPLCGEVLTLLSVLFFSAQILCLDRFGGAAHPARLTTIEFAVVGAASLLAGLFAPGGLLLYERSGFAALMGSWTFQWTSVSTVLFSAVLAFHLMNTFQPRLTPAVAGVMYTFEPVCAAVFSILLGAEVLHSKLFLGGGLILVAALLAVRAEVQTRPAPAAGPSLPLAAQEG